MTDERKGMGRVVWVKERRERQKGRTKECEESERRSSKKKSNTARERKESLTTRKEAQLPPPRRHRGLICEKESMASRNYRLCGKEISSRPSLISASRRTQRLDRPLYPPVFSSRSNAPLFPSFGPLLRRCFFGWRSEKMKCLGHTMSRGRKFRGM